jgi:hypothetical protein
MAKPKKKKLAAKKGPPPKKGGGKSPLKGMLIGAAIFVAIAAFFMLRVGGATPFEHLRRALTDDGPKTAETTKAPARSEAPKAKAKRPAVAKDAAKAKPMEAVSAQDQADLAKLIEQRTK